MMSQPVGHPPVVVAWPLQWWVGLVAVVAWPLHPLYATYLSKT